MGLTCALRHEPPIGVVPENAGDLRQVITERGKYHGLGSTWVVAYPSPGILNQVGELRAPLKAAFRTIVKAIPKSERTLDDVAGVEVAVGQCPRKETCRGHGKLATHGRAGNRFVIATGSSSQGRTVTERGGCAQGVAAGILPADVAIYIQFFPVILQGAQSLVAADGNQHAVRANEDIRQRRGAVAAHTLASEEVHADIQVLREKVGADVDAGPAACA